MRWGARVVAALALVAAAALSAAPAAADVNVDDFEFESFHADYRLTRGDDGRARLEVTETIVAVFPDFDQNRGFYRDIPEYRHGVRLHTFVQSVVDEFGQPVPYDTELYQDFYSVALGDDSFVHGRQTYVITYRQRDVVEPFADTGADEFYWDVNGTGWAQPFGEVSVSLTVDAGVAAELNGSAACYRVGGDCGEPFAPRTADDGSVRFDAAIRDVVPGESLTIAVGFRPGTFEPGMQVVPPPTDVWGGWPEWEDEPELTGFDAAAPFVLAPIAIGLGWAARATHTSGGTTGRTRASDVIVPRFERPGTNVMVCAYVAGSPERAFTAQVVDLAVRGKLRLLEPGNRVDDDFSAELLDRTGLDPLETQLVDALFGSSAQPGERVRLRSRAFGARLTAVHRAVDREVRAGGFRGASRPTVGWLVLAVLAFATVGVAVWLLFRASSLTGETALAWLALLAAGWGVVAVLRSPAEVAPLSERGRDLNDELLGIKDYLELAEADRIRMLQSPSGAERVDVDDDTQMLKLYERLLPFAIIWGIERDWVREIVLRAEAAKVQPAWLSGSGDVTAWRLQSTISSVRRAMPAPPSAVEARAARAKGEGGGGFWGGSSGGWSSGRSGSGWSSSSGSSSRGGSRGGGYSGGGGGGGGGRGR